MICLGGRASVAARPGRATWGGSRGFGLGRRAVALVATLGVHERGHAAGRCLGLYKNNKAIAELEPDVLVARS